MLSIHNYIIFFFTLIYNIVRSKIYIFSIWYKILILKTKIKMPVLIFISILVLVVTIFYYYLKNRNTFWKKRGINGPEPRMLVGNVGESLVLKKSVGQIYTEVCREYPNEPLIGIYSFLNPTLVVQDPLLIRDIMVRKFNHFTDIDLDIDKEADPLGGRNPFVLNGDEWKKVRAQLTPNFSSGKMKALFPLLTKVCKDLTHYIKNRESPIEVQNLCRKFTTDNVASCAFGLEGNSFNDENSEFLQIGKSLSDPDLWTILKAVIALLSPAIAKYFKLSFFPKKMSDRLIDIVKTTLKYRKDNNIVRNDYLDIIAKLKDTVKDFTDIDVTAHAASFFIDGFETSSVALTYFIYELASSSEVQGKLRKEILEAEKEGNGEIDYDILQGMQYLEACLSESLRKNPPVYHTMRRCTQDFVFTNDEIPNLKQNLSIKRGQSIILPLFAIHMDPKNFENPEKFNPDRFLGENKGKIKKFTYFPFGEGPRTCIGQRFAQLQIKVGIVEIVKNFEISVHSKTTQPLEDDPKYFLKVAKGGVFINFEPIASKN